MVFSDFYVIKINSASLADFNAFFFIILAAMMQNPSLPLTLETTRGLRLRACGTKGTVCSWTTYKGRKRALTKQQEGQNTLQEGEVFLKLRKLRPCGRLNYPTLTQLFG